MPIREETNLHLPQVPDIGRRWRVGLRRSQGDTGEGTTHEDGTDHEAEDAAWTKRWKSATQEVCPRSASRLAISAYRPTPHDFHADLPQDRGGQARRYDHGHQLHVGTSRPCSGRTTGAVPMLGIARRRPIRPRPDNPIDAANLRDLLSGLCRPGVAVTPIPIPVAEGSRESRNRSSYCRYTRL